MNGVLALARRCCLCYFRDKASVLFSMMAALIVLLLYLLFLRDMLISNYPDIDGMSHLVDAWVLSGMLSIVSVTSCTGVLQTMITDRTEGRDSDILVTPMGPFQVAGGYILSTFLVGLIMSFAVFVIAIAYLALTGCPLSAQGVLTTAALLIPSALSGSVIMFGITTFIRSVGAFSGMTTIVSVVIGFITGIYMPMGAMPQIMQDVAVFVPATQMSALFRKALAGDAMDSAFAGADPSVVREFRVDMGFDLFTGGAEFTLVLSMVLVLVLTAVFFGIAALNVRKR